MNTKQRTDDISCLLLTSVLRQSGRTAFGPTVTPTPTLTATATNTPVPPTATDTLEPPTFTPTPTPRIGSRLLRLRMACDVLCACW